MPNRKAKSIKQKKGVVVITTTMQNVHAPTDLVPKRALPAQFDADRLEVWQRSHKRDAPTMPLAYGFAVKAFLDAYEQQTGHELLHPDHN